jgi:PASTA domain
MNTVLLSAGAACVIIAVVGGGASAFGVEIPLIEDLRRQVLLFVVGLAFLGAAIALDNGDGGSKGGNGGVVGQPGVTYSIPDVVVGGKTAEVPDVRGESIEQAESELEAAGFSRHTLEDSFTSDSSLVGKVVRTGPPQGWDWPTDKQITLFVGQPFG